MRRRHQLLLLFAVGPLLVKGDQRIRNIAERPRKSSFW